MIRMKTLVTVLASLAVLVSVGAIAGGIAWLKKMQIEAAASSGGHGPMPETVTAYPVEPTSYRQSTTAVGTIVASKWITLRNEVSGAVTQISLVSGATVRQGEIMMELDKSVEQASLESAEARCKIAESTYKRTKQASLVKGVTDLEVEQAQAEMDQAKAERARLKAIIEKKTLRAPFPAQAGIVNVHQGQYLSEGTEITTLQGIGDYIYVDFMMPQTIADEVVIGQPVSIQHGEKHLEGLIEAFDSKADRSTRNMMVRAILKNPPASLSPNDSVRVDIEYGKVIEAMSVPIEAIRRTPIGAHVFIVEKDANGNSIASMQSILPGRTIGNRQTVMSGLKEGQSVIADGSFKLRSGSPIVVRPPASTEK